MREIISCQNSRVFALERLWEKELTDMRKKLMNPKKKNGPKKAVQLKMLEEIEKVPSDIRNIALKRYLNACKQRNALAFFQWRSRKNSQKEGLIQMIFANRLEVMNVKKELRDQILSGDLSDNMQKHIMDKITD